MPTATTTKSAMAGTKRKSAPVKNGHVKESKKPKIELKSAMKSKPVKKVEMSSDDSEDSDSEGGAPLDDVESGGVEEGESDPETLPKTDDDGIHPERVKAVVANS
jgi:pumilio homology domain family member 6